MGNPGFTQCSNSSCAILYITLQPGDDFWRFAHVLLGNSLSHIGHMHCVLLHLLREPSSMFVDRTYFVNLRYNFLPNLDVVIDRPQLSMLFKRLSFLFWTDYWSIRYYCIFHFQSYPFLKYYNCFRFIISSASSCISVSIMPANWYFIRLALGLGT